MRRLSLLVPVAFLLMTCTAFARTWHIEADGSGDAPTIKAGVDSASSGDTVLVAAGTYHESYIDMKSGIVLLSETGQADCVTIDADRVNSVFMCHDSDSVVIQGFTITDGEEAMPLPPGFAGGMMCFWSSPLEIVNCNFVGNWSFGYGGGVYCEYCSPRFINCTFAGNQRASYGGGLFCNVASPTLQNCIFTENVAGRGGGVCCVAWSNPSFINCTFYGNHGAKGGGGLYCAGDCMPTLENTIIACSTSGKAIMCVEEFSGAILSCCDVYGNHGGDWVDCIAGQEGIDGNFSACPSFCNADMGDFHLCDGSPCAPGNHPDGYDCGLIGAWDVGCSCGPTPTELTTWGAIKVIFR